MCTTKKPKTVTAPVPGSEDKRLPILRNPYIDGANAFANRGVSALRIDRARPSGTTRTPPVTPPVVTLPPPVRPTVPGTSTGDPNPSGPSRPDFDPNARYGGGSWTTNDRLILSRF